MTITTQYRIKRAIQLFVDDNPWWCMLMAFIIGFWVGY